MSKRIKVIQRKRLKLFITFVYNNVDDGSDDWQPDEEDTFEYALLQDYFQGNLTLHWNLPKTSETRRTCWLIINIYQLLMSINTYVSMMFVLHEVLNMTSIIVCIGVSTPPQNVLNMEAVHHDPSPIQNLDFSKTPCYNFVLPSLIKFLVKILSLKFKLWQRNSFDVLFRGDSHYGKHWDYKSRKLLCIYDLFCQRENVMQWYLMCWGFV